jgi:NADPH:quinone reductase-like Zn-dependent oxidoreductase
MEAAIVWEAGKPPVYGEFKDPSPSEGESLIAVAAAALSPLAKSRASGAHYSSSGRFPFVAGVDGVGRLDGGRRVYFILPREPYGAMAERTVAPASQCVPLPDALDDIVAAAIANPGMSSWAAFKERARLVAGESVLINGATGTAGRLAVQIAKYLGAKKVIATGRNVEILKSLASLGADVAIPLVEDADALEDALKRQFAEGVDVVIDYLWGKSAERLLIAAAKAAKPFVPIRFVQVGSAGGSDIVLPSAVLRSSRIELLGSGLGSVPADRLVAAIAELLQAAVAAGFQIAAKAVALSEVESAWAKDTGEKRIVFTLD